MSIRWNKKDVALEWILRRQERWCGLPGWIAQCSIDCRKRFSHIPLAVLANAMLGFAARAHGVKCMTRRP
jgi:hypothetical protein